jgi:hypothetical protein
MTSLFLKMKEISKLFLTNLEESNTFRLIFYLRNKQFALLNLKIIFGNHFYRYIKNKQIVMIFVHNVTKSNNFQ